MPALNFGGQESFAASPQRLFALLTDMDSMARLIPDLASAEKVSDHAMRCVVRPGFSFLRGTLRLDLQLSQVLPDSRACMTVGANGIGVSMTVVSQLEIEPEGASSRLTWNATVDQMRGLVATVSPALIRAAADQVIRHTWSLVRQELGDANC